MPRPPNQHQIQSELTPSSQLQELFVQMRWEHREVFDKLQSAMNKVQQEALQQQSFLFSNHECYVQQIVGRFLPQDPQVFESRLSEEKAFVLDLKSLKRGCVAAPSNGQELAVNGETYHNGITVQDSSSPPLLEKGENEGDPEVRVQRTFKRGQTRGQSWIAMESSSSVETREVQMRKTGVCVKIVHSKAFTIAVSLMILANALYLGIEADWNDADSLADSAWGFQVCEQFFCSFFVCEIIIRLGAYKNKTDALQDVWFLLDLFLVVMMVIEAWIFNLAMSSILSNPPNTGAVGGIGRMFRLLRLMRISKMMKVLPELATMVKGMVAAIRACHAALLIQIILVYVFAIIMNTLIGEDKRVDEYFATVRDSMITLLLQGVFLDEISGLVHTLIDVKNYLSILSFFIFVLMSYVTVMNMLIGVLCQVVIDVSAHEKEEMVKTKMKSSLLVMLKSLDADGSGELSKAELQSVFRQPEAIAIMKEIEVDTEHLLDLIEMLYESDDSNLPIAAIMNVVLSLRGERPLRMDDLVKGHNFILWAFESQLASHRQKMLKMMTQELAQKKVATPSLANSLDGDWTRATISGSILTWSSGQTSPIIFMGSRECRVNWDGIDYSAVLKDDGRLYWSDGDVWSRM